MEDEEVLNRVVREARKSTGPIAPKIEDAGKRKEKKEKRHARTSSRRTTEAAAAAAAPPATSATKAERRSRSRRRRRKEVAPAPVAAPAEEAENGVDDGRKVVLTPNVQFLRDSYHHPKDGYPEGVGEPSKWHFRAEPLSPMEAAQMSIAPGAPQRPPGEYGAGMPPLHHPVPYGMPPGMPPPRATGAPAVPPRPMKTIAPKKWKVARANTIVKETEQLNSAEVRVLNEGEIVEQVAPSLTLSGGIVRVLIRHPSSPQFPNPIGWVTSDATAAGGPKFLEPGPEPMSRGKPWAPPMGTRAAADMQAWRAPGPAAAAAPFHPVAPRPAAAPAATMGPKGFQNLVWTPSAS